MTTMADPTKVLEAVQRVKDGLEDPLIYMAVCESTGIDPLGPIKIKVVTTKRDRHRAGRLTQLVWNSLLPDGSVDPTKAVPISAVNTNELPIVEPVGEAVGDDPVSVGELG